jgi:type II secretory pathway component PulF
VKEIPPADRALVLRQVAVLLRQGASSATAVRAVADRMPRGRSASLERLADALDRADPFAEEVDPSLVALARAEETGPEPLERVAETIEDTLEVEQRVRARTLPLFALAAASLVGVSAFAVVLSFLEDVWADMAVSLPGVTVLGINAIALVPWLVPLLAVALVVAWRQPAVPLLPGAREVALVRGLRDFAAAVWSGRSLERAGELVGARDGDLRTAEALRLDERELAFLGWLLERHEPASAAATLADAVDRGALASALQRRTTIFLAGVVFVLFAIGWLLASVYLPIFTIAGNVA